MTSRIIRVGSVRYGTDQFITTSYSTDPDGQLRAHITMETPKEITDTARLRLLSTWEMGKNWPS
jgi:hypothetical protein